MCCMERPPTPNPAMRLAGVVGPELCLGAAGICSQNQEKLLCYGQAGSWGPGAAPGHECREDRFLAQRFPNQRQMPGGLSDDYDPKDVSKVATAYRGSRQGHLCLWAFLSVQVGR